LVYSSNESICAVKNFYTNRIRRYKEFQDYQVCVVRVVSQITETEIMKINEERASLLSVDGEIVHQIVEVNSDTKNCPDLINLIRQELVLGCEKRSQKAKSSIRKKPGILENLSSLKSFKRSAKNKPKPLLL